MKKKKSIIPWLFVLLIGTFMLLDIAFVRLAFKSYSGTYTDNHYQKGVDFNKVYQSGIYNDKTGWKGEITVSKNYDKVIFALKDAKGNSISKANVKAKLMRPVTTKFDQIFELAESSKGLYESPLNLELEGQWEIRVKAIKDNSEYISTIRINTEEENEKK